MSETGASRRGEVLELLATYGERRPDEVPEGIDSLELAWLIHQIEQRYGGRLDLDDAELSRMSTVTGAAELLGELRAVESRTGADADPIPDPAGATAGNGATGRIRGAADDG